MKKNKLIGQIAIIVVVTAAIVMAGMWLPRLLIGNKITSNAQLNESVEAEAISPYGEDVIKKQTDIMNALNNYSYELYSGSYKVLSSYDSSGAGMEDKMYFTNKFIDSLSRQYSLSNIEFNKYNILGTQDYAQMGIAHVSDGTLHPDIDMYVEENSGILLYSSLNFASRRYESADFWKELLDLYSETVGADFLEYVWINDFMKFGGIATSADGNLYLEVVCTISLGNSIGDSRYQYNMEIMLYTNSRTSLSDIEEDIYSYYETYSTIEVSADYVEG